MRNSRMLLTSAAIAAAALIAAPAAAQQGRQAQRSAGDNTLSFPGGEPVVQITADAPQEAKVGESFDLQVQVRNVSDNIAVHDLVIAQQGAQQWEIQSSRIEGQPQDRQNSGQAKKKQGQKKQGQKKQGQSQQEQRKQRRNQQGQDQQDQDQEDRNQQQEQDQQRQSQQQGQDQQRQGQQQQGQQQQGQQGQGQSRWTISKLMPGETRTIHITAISDQEGDQNVCLAVESYTPALCLSTKFTKPELEIVKRAPERVDICETIEFEYFVENAGSGNLEQFTVEDQLPEGVKTIEGQDRLKFTLEDGLEAGEVRKFVARLWATRTGEISSRAEVRGPDGVSARSNRTTTQVVKPDLAISLDGPSVREVDSVANYTVRVTNQGESPAPFTQLTLHYPRSADLVRAGDPRQSSREVQSGSQQARSQQQSQQRFASENVREVDAQRNRDQAQDRRNQQDSQAGNQQQRQKQRQSQQQGQQQQGQQAQQRQGQQQDRQNMARRQWNLGTLEPGQTVELSYALRLYEGGEVQQIAVAEYVCEMAEDREMTEDMFQVRDTLLTEAIALPGMRLTVVDNKDPVSTAEQVTYTIKVANEGNAEASDVQLTAQLPDHLEFVEVSGDTEGKNSQGEVTFEPVQTIQPGESATWELVVKVNEAADEPITVEMTMAELDQPITAEEPTVFFSQQRGQQGQQGQSPQRKQNQGQQNQGQQKEQNEDQDQ